MAAEQPSYPASEAPLTSTPSRPKDGDGVRQYYIAVDRAQFKMGTLVELLAVLGKRDGLPLIICCSARDSLDAVCATVAGSRQFFVSILHSDLEESERATSLETFRLAMSEWNYFNLERSSVEAAEGELRPGKSQVLVMTDACLPSHALGETPLTARIMINFDIPSKKEAYSRRMAACLGTPVIGPSGASPASSTRTSTGSISNFAGGKMVINMIVGGEVSALRSLEESSGIVIDALPINVHIQHFHMSDVVCVVTTYIVWNIKQPKTICAVMSSSFNISVPRFTSNLVHVQRSVVGFLDSLHVWSSN